ncbi:MAG: phosphoribosylamine--glycine ligase [Pseudomonadota bacterium]|nr:phosphoribosylamine--glycine ligase [Pseudomonadota bacterium]
MRILVIGNGGREHALAWKLAESSSVERVFVAPGNPGTALEAKCENVPIGVMDFHALTAFAGSQSIDLTVVGPEAPLVAGIKEAFDAKGLLCLAPSQAASRLEGSKRFAKEFMVRHQIPTASFEAFTTPGPAKQFARALGVPLVVKADGLAAGKGVVIATTYEAADQIIDDMLSGNAFGDAGAEVVIEEFLRGEEASYIVISDGERTCAFASSQDHKRIFDHDEGPNTGGMGAYSPAPVVTPSVAARVEETIIQPVIRGMKAEGLEYKGFLYAGLMIDSEGLPKVIEFNCRFGDPETQPVMMRLKEDLGALCLAAAKGAMASRTLNFTEQSSIAVVMASEGYPQTPVLGDEIVGVSGELSSKVFHAGTQFKDDTLVTSGGRVLAVTALGEDLKSAQTSAYLDVNRISFRGSQFRSDIGARGIKS